MPDGGRSREDLFTAQNSKLVDVQKHLSSIRWSLPDCRFHLSSEPSLIFKIFPAVFRIPLAKMFSLVNEE